jgi:hypothetical protein
MFNMEGDKEEDKPDNQEEDVYLEIADERESTISKIN